MGRKKKTNYIYTSPDGGHTVYQQEFGSDIKVQISQDDYAMAELDAHEQSHMTGREAVLLRKKYPALQEAWDQYATMWTLCVNDDEVSNSYTIKFLDE